MKGKIAIYCFCLGIYSVAVVTIAAPRDPTRPANIKSAAVVQAKDFVVSSIMVAPGRRYAIVNGKSVKAGDKIKGAKVVSIRPNVVILNSQGNLVKVYLYPRVRK